MSSNQYLALFVYQNQLEFRSCVSGDHDYGFDFPYELDNEYHIEISQSKEDGKLIYRLLINGEIENSTINTEPSAILLFSKLCK